MAEANHDLPSVQRLDREMEVRDLMQMARTASQEQMREWVEPEKRTAADYMRWSRSASTYRSYRDALIDFLVWSGEEFPFPASPATVANYLVERAPYFALASMEMRLQALRFAHRRLKMPDPTLDEDVVAVMDGMRRYKAEDKRKGVKLLPDPLAKARAKDKQRKLPEGRRRIRAPVLDAQQLRAVIEATYEEETLAALRDRTLILIGVYGAFRQSELSGLTIEQMEINSAGVAFELGTVKQDQTGAKHYATGIPRVPNKRLCPVENLEHWLAQAGITEGPIFRSINRHGGLGDKPLSHTGTNAAIKRWVGRAGIANPETYSGHSLRATFVTLMRGSGVSEGMIARQTHHANLNMLSVYDRPTDALRDNPAVLMADILAQVESPKLS